MLNVLIFDEDGAESLKQCAMLFYELIDGLAVSDV